MRSRRIRVLLVDDHAIVLEGYRSLLGKYSDIEVVGEASDAEEAYRRCQSLLPDVVVLDISMPGQSGLEATARIRQRLPDMAILIFSMHQNPSFALQAIRAGAKGYVTKSSAPDVLVRAIHEVSEGRNALSPDIAQALALSQVGSNPVALGELTVREFEILRMLCEAHSTRDIAAALHISPKTVSNCHYDIKRKLGVGSDIELLRLALKLRVVDLIEPVA